MDSATNRTHAPGTSAGRQIPSANQCKGTVGVSRIGGSLSRRFEPHQNRTTGPVAEIENDFFAELVTSSVKSSVVTKNSASWSMNLLTAAVAWSVIVGLAAFYGIRLGYTGRSFALALGGAAALFAFELFLAAPRVLERVRHLFGEHGAVLAPLVPLFGVLIYTIGVTANWKTALLGAA